MIEKARVLMRFGLIPAFALTVSGALVGGAFAADAKLVSTCQVTKPSKQVIFFKQWHLAPGVNTQDILKSKRQPQYRNQKALYEELDRWIQEKKDFPLFAEGCASPRQINSSATEKFNGWSIAALSAKASSPDYADILTNVSFKLEAKWKDQLKAFCGDDQDAIHQNLLAFSDARGAVGFLTRLEQYRKDPIHAESYLDGVIDLYHLPPGTTVDQAIARLNLELKKIVDSLEHWIDVRNQKLVDAISANPSPVVAVVFGGAHAAGVQKLLEKKGIGCSILEPEGYQDDEGALLQALKDLINQRLQKS
jgi:hypothetical protein